MFHVQGTRQYRCARIPNSPLTVGFVWEKKRSVLELDEQPGEFVFEENQLLADWVRQL